MVSEFILWEQMILNPGGQLEPSGHGWQDLRSKPLCIATYFGLHGFIKVFFKVYPIKKSMETNDTQGVHGQFGLKGHSWHNLCRGPPDIALY